MPSPELLTLFFVAALALAVTPGPDNLFVLTQSALHGRGPGLAVTLGLCTGLVVHSLAVALGVAALLAASPIAFTALRWLGAAYLGYLAWQLLRHAGSADLNLGRDPSDTLGRFYRRGIIMNVSNPKVAIFFLAFLPQFVRPDSGPAGLQIAVLGGVFMLATLLVFGGIALTAAPLGAWLRRSPRASRWLDRGAAGILLALAIGLIGFEG